MLSLFDLLCCFRLCRSGSWKVEAHKDQQEHFGNFGEIADGGGVFEIERLIAQEDP